MRILDRIAIILTTQPLLQIFFQGESSTWELSFIFERM